ncbi:uncharacterized protein LOC132717474 [Ruditapes philippinarum]|uniref:uncharacterized protein LOC132717474 n=1 Tax=Ruditapes philippinarum TaxID=129788 RepID=UPI00295B7178|nr:uncharacterized protein LOC132717474 [Ruditapes philippinarum]
MRFKQAKPVHLKAKYRSYSPTALQNAYKSVVESGTPVLRASKLFGVPQQTLRDRVLGKIDPECITTGREPVLNMFEEAKIVQHIKTMANYGYGYTMQECVDIATEYAVSVGKRTRDNPLTLRWMDGFRKRWPEVKVSNPRSIEHVRAKMTSEATVNAYFSNLLTTLTKNDLLDKPHRIFNVDEKGISLNHKPPHIVSCSTGPPAVTTGKSKTITILGCGSAGGIAIPPYFVFPGKRMLPELLEGSSPGASGTVSDSGWSNSAIFRTYLEEHFIKYLPGGTAEPVLLLLDGHKSHVSVDLVEWAKSQNIIIFVLPAHTSHILQPLDVAVFGPFQKIYNNECHKFMRMNSTNITRYNVCQLACRAYTKSLSSENLQSAFKKTGICPFDKFAVPQESLVPAVVFQDIDMAECTDTDSQATVEGGIVVDKDASGDFLLEREMTLRKVKSEKPKQKVRNTMSRIVSGKDLSAKSVLDSMKQHEINQKGHKKSTSKKGSKSFKIKKSVMHAQMDNEPQPGPSHITVNASISSDSDTETIIDSEVCCVCSNFEPVGLAKKKSVTFVQWAQCDGIKNHVPCKHWTHLGFCTNKKSVDKTEKFFCPHCSSRHEE